MKEDNKNSLEFKSNKVSFTAYPKDGEVVKKLLASSGNDMLKQISRIVEDTNELSSWFRISGEFSKGKAE